MKKHITFSVVLLSLTFLACSHGNLRIIKESSKNGYKAFIIERKATNMQTGHRQWERTGDKFQNIDDARKKFKELEDSKIIKQVVSSRSK